MQWSIDDRLSWLLDGINDGAPAPTAIPVPMPADDPLKFKDKKKYKDRLAAAREDTGAPEAFRVLRGSILGEPVVVASLDFDFMAGSMSRAVGAAVVTAAHYATQHKLPLLAITASGGARMQESTLSLMQMARTTAAVAALKEAHLPFVVLLTNPTTGGTTASFAMLGDVHMAEPGALIGFAGPRVIEQTIRQTLPEGFQKAEYLLEHGMVDMVTHRSEQKETLRRLFSVMTSSHRT